MTSSHLLPLRGLAFLICATREVKQWILRNLTFVKFQLHLYHSLLRIIERSNCEEIEASACLPTYSRSRNEQVTSRLEPRLSASIPFPRLQAPL